MSTIAEPEKYTQNAVKPPVKIFNSKDGSSAGEIRDINGVIRWKESPTARVVYHIDRDGVVKKEVIDVPRHVVAGNIVNGRSHLEDPTISEVMKLEEKIMGSTRLGIDAFTKRNTVTTDRPNIGARALVRLNQHMEDPTILPDGNKVKNFIRRIEQSPGDREGYGLKEIGDQEIQVLDLERTSPHHKGNGYIVNRKTGMIGSVQDFSYPAEPVRSNRGAIGEDASRVRPMIMELEKKEPKNSK